MKKTSLSTIHSHETLIPKHVSISPRSSAHKVVGLLRRTTFTRCCKQDLKGQTVAVVGMGLSGRAAAKLALTRGASVIAVDKNENLNPLEHDSTFDKCGDLKTILGHCDMELLKSADRIVVSPGVPIENYGVSSLLQSIFCIDDLEHDLINPYDLADRVNDLIIKEFLLQGVLSAFFLLTSHWFLFFVSAPITFYHLKLHKEQNHLIDITGVFSVLKSEKQFRMIKVGCYAVPFLTVALRLVFSTARSFVDENVTVLDLH